MSRRTTLAALAAVTALALTACGGSPEETDPAAGPTAGDDAFPVTVEHIWGETTVPDRPERVVALGVTDTDPLLALGVVPVAVTPFVFYADSKGVGPWAEDRFGDVEPEVFTSAEVDVEAVAALAPDLIVGVSAGFDEAVYAQLSEIAPTLVRPEGTVAYGVDRDTATRMIAQAVGEEARGEELIAEADQAFADALAEHPELEGATGTAALYSGGTYYAFLPADARGRVLGDLGITAPEAVLAEDTGDSFYVELSAERLDLLDGDVLVVLTDPDSVATVESDALLAQVPVVAGGGLLVDAGDVRGAMSYNTVLSAPYLAQNLTPLLASALAATA
ncbi:iron-siderophore ABC transporter substrate-binding protein [Klenkia taihuensis]|uniref:Iron complex transport system substrate-binding protein n=1 Tax=Klenkia taihuensis TaxID=1225127 RepID=A0A1I1HRD4_9ACTN|nr:iron-siderophore ABC transporter substrate-binding protein [Klenkia taihuensis]GHE09065.1 iron ABC transporter substrate-binding protein [Klenkia taihuensis]SFC26375.1 iron complex transport system substrate-binding protein [Klenkia taihuensis]